MWHGEKVYGEKKGGRITALDRSAKIPQCQCIRPVTALLHLLGQVFFAKQFIQSKITGTKYYMK